MAQRSRKKRAAGGPGRPKRGSESLRPWHWGLILFALVVAVYLPVWGAGYIWDDDQVLTANPVIVGPGELADIWTTKAADICPLTLTTFWLEHAIWGLTPLPYHVVNVLFHAGAAVALWQVLRRLAVPGAWLGAALWALHPVQAESVAWITEMKNTESGLFFLLSILFFIPTLKQEILPWRAYTLTLLFAALAIASKSSAVVLPVMLLLVAWWLEGRWQWRNLGRVAPIFFLSALAAAVSIWTQAAGGANNWAQSWPARFVTAGDAVWFYLGKLLWPDPLMLIYPRWHIDAAQGLGYIPLVGVVTLSIALIGGRKEVAVRACLFAWACFLIALLPVLGFANMTFFRHSFVADHLQYLAAMAPLALAGASLARLAEFAPLPVPRLWPALGAGLLLVLGAVSWQRAAIFQSQESLWSDNVSKNPDCWDGYVNLGNIAFARGDLDGAARLYEKTVALNPNNGAVYSDLGNVSLTRHQYDQAIAEFKRALELDPGHGQVLSNLGMAYYFKGDLDAAIDTFHQALRLDPAMAPVHNNLGLALEKKGDVADAAAEFQAAVQLKPDFASAQQNLADAQRFLQQKTDAH